jgi:8-oxo-dGTP diphosphatase
LYGVQMTENIIQVAAGLVFHRGKLLITKRRRDDHLGGLWEFPGGKLESAETFEHCLGRELNEELGIEVEIGREIEDITHAYPEKTVRLKFFQCSLLRGCPKPLHCDAVAWVTRDELPLFEFPGADAEVLEKIRGDTGFWY